MNMEMKKNWVTPEAALQVFEANEYVAACWRIGCTITGLDEHDPWSGYENCKTTPWGNQPHSSGCVHDNSHSADGCGNPDHNAIYQVGEHTYSITEVGVDGSLSGLPCTFYTENWGEALGTTIEITNPSEKVQVWWSTSRNNNGINRTWYHTGFAELIDALVSKSS